MKYPIDERLHKLARLNQPVNRLYFLAANAVLRPFIRTPKGKGLSHRYIKFKTEYGKVRIHLIRPENTEGALPCMVYFHGGAFMRYAAPHHYRLMKRYALEGNIAVAFVDFYLAPKYKSNRIEGQCLSAYEYLWTHSDALCLNAPMHWEFPSLERPEKFLFTPSFATRSFICVTLIAPHFLSVSSSFPADLGALFYFNALLVPLPW